MAIGRAYWMCIICKRGYVLVRCSSVPISHARRSNVALCSCDFASAHAVDRQSSVRRPHWTRSTQCIRWIYMLVGSTGCCVWTLHGMCLVKGSFTISLPRVCKANCRLGNHHFRQLNKSSSIWPRYLQSNCGRQDEKCDVVIRIQSTSHITTRSTIRSAPGECLTVPLPQTVSSQNRTRCERAQWGIGVRCPLCRQ